MGHLPDFSYYLIHNTASLIQEVRIGFDWHNIGEIIVVGKESTNLYITLSEIEKKIG